MFFGGVHAVRRETNGAVSGAADERRDGAVLCPDSTDLQIMLALSDFVLYTLGCRNTPKCTHVSHDVVRRRARPAAVRRFHPAQSRKLSTPAPACWPGCACFALLIPNTLIAIERTGAYRRFSPFEQIIDRDGRTTDVFFIVRGRARIVNYSVTRPRGCLR